MVSVKNWQCFYLFNIGKIGQENVFENILERKKNAFPRYKNKKLKKTKKGFVHCFGQKLAIFPSLYYGQNTPVKCVSECSRKKKAFPDYKNKELKKSKKLGFFQKG